MKKTFLYAMLIAFGCSSQKNVSPSKSDTTTIAVVNTTTIEGEGESKSPNPTKTDIIDNTPSGENETKSANPSKTAMLNNPSDPIKMNSDKNNVSGFSGVPVCLKKMIEQFKKEEVQNPPRKIFSYSYKGNTVYYVTPPCCDFFSDLYDDNCKIIAHPDGGITGKGDKRAPDFISTRSNEQLVWEDKRSQNKK